MLGLVVQALGEKYGPLPGYEEEKKAAAKEPKHKGVGKKTVQLATTTKLDEDQVGPLGQTLHLLLNITYSFLLSLKLCAIGSIVGPYFLRCWLWLRLQFLR